MISIPDDCRFEFSLEKDGPARMTPSTTLIALEQTYARWSQGDANAIHRTDDDDGKFPRSISYRVVFDAVSGLDVIIQEAPGPVEIPTMVETAFRCLRALMHRNAGPDPVIDPVEIAIALAETARMHPGATMGVASVAMPWRPMRVFHRDQDGRPWAMDVSAEIECCDAVAVPPALRIEYHAQGRNPSIRIGRLSVHSPDISKGPRDAVAVLRAMATLERLRSRNGSCRDQDGDIHP